MDIGCGTSLILRHLPPGSVGINLNPRHLTRAANYVSSADLRIGDAENLEFPDNHFSVVVCTEVIEYLVRPKKALSEIKRVLEPGGWFSYCFNYQNSCLVAF